MPSPPPRRSASSAPRPARSSARGSTAHRPPCAAASTASRSKPVVPITTGHVAPRGTPRRSRRPRPGCVKSIAASHPLRPGVRASTTSCPASLEGGHEQRRRPSRTPRSSATSRDQRRLRRQERRVDALARASAEPAFVRADSGRRRVDPVREASSASAATSLGRHGFESLSRSRSMLEKRRVRDRRLAEPRHAVRRRLEREEEPPLEVLLRPCELVGTDVPGGDVRKLRDGYLEARGKVLLTRADVDADLARRRRTGRSSCRPSTPSRASRGSPGRAATRPEPPTIASSTDAANRRSSMRRDPRCAEADVVLLGVLALESDARLPVRARRFADC